MKSYCGWGSHSAYIFLAFYLTTFMNSRLPDPGRLLVRQKRRGKRTAQIRKAMMDECSYNTGAAWLKARLVNAEYSQPAWSDVEGAAPQNLTDCLWWTPLSVIALGHDMAVKVVAEPTTAVRSKKGEVRATAEFATGRKGSEYEGENIGEKETSGKRS